MKKQVEDLSIEGVSAFNNEVAEGIVIEWCAKIGWGQCEIYRDKSDASGKWNVDTESMSSNDDKTFLKMLLDKLADMVEVTG